MRKIDIEKSRDYNNLPENSFLLRDEMNGKDFS